MADYRATIRTISDATPDPGGGLVVEHHRTPRAALEVELWSGGHLLHLAVAGCLFNDLLREAPNRGIPVEYLSVTADGDFDANGSSGIRYAIDIRSSADRAAVEGLVADIEAGAIIPEALRAGIAVEPIQLRILTD